MCYNGVIVEEEKIMTNQHGVDCSIIKIGDAVSVNDGLDDLLIFEGNSYHGKIKVCYNHFEHGIQQLVMKAEDITCHYAKQERAN